MYTNWITQLNDAELLKRTKLSLRARRRRHSTRRRRRAAPPTTLDLPVLPACLLHWACLPSQAIARRSIAHPDLAPAGSRKKRAAPLKGPGTRGGLHTQAASRQPASHTCSPLWRPPGGARPHGRRRVQPVVHVRPRRAVDAQGRQLVHHRVVPHRNVPAGRRGRGGEAQAGQAGSRYSGSGGCWCRAEGTLEAAQLLHTTGHTTQPGAELEDAAVALACRTRPGRPRM